MPESEKIRLLIVDDHKVVRNGLKIFISLYDDVELVGEAKNGRLAIERCAQLQPDVVLMDLRMPEMDGPTAIRHIRARFPTIQVVALTSFEEEKLVELAMTAGAIGYLYKDVEEDDLIGAIRAAHKGRSVLAQGAMQALVKQASNQNDSSAMDALTPRETEIIALVARGMTNPQIAEYLVLSPSTVSFHMNNILSKLQVRTRAEAVAQAIQNGLI